MQTTSLVSIVMPVYNGEKFLPEAVESILKQTFHDFEFIIINDGSTDSSPEILAQYKQQDDRIKIINQQNSGIVDALNRGFQCAKGKFIARMDADDISAQNRLEKQIGFLNANPDVGIVGTSCTLINEQGYQFKQVAMPEGDLEIRWNTLFRSSFIHPSVVIRQNLIAPLESCYDQTFYPAEDYDLWRRLLKKTKGANLKEALLFYRIQKGSISSRLRDRQTEAHLKVSMRTIENVPEEFEINPGLFRDLIIDIVGLYPEVKLNRNRAILAQIYLELWDHFLEANNQECTDVLQNKVIVKAAKLALIPFFQKGALASSLRLSKMNKYWILLYLLSLPAGLVARMKAIYVTRIRSQSQSQLK